MRASLALEPQLQAYAVKATFRDVLKSLFLWILNTNFITRSAGLLKGAAQLKGAQGPIIVTEIMKFFSCLVIYQVI